MRAAVFCASLFAAAGSVAGFTVPGVLAPARYQTARSPVSPALRAPSALNARNGGYLSSLSSPNQGTAMSAGSITNNPEWALLFDCDGVIVETEELHRLAYNGAFQHFDLKTNGQPVVWDVPYYDILQNTVGGGKPKMKWHFSNEGWPTSTVGGVPATEEEQNALVDQLQDQKTVIYKQIVSEAAEPRPGVIRLIDEVLARTDIAAGICSAATKGGFDQVVNSLVGQDRLGRLDVVMAGDDVPRKKPDPIIYQLAAEKVGLPVDRCVVVEDSLVGLRAAKGAGMKCIITYTDSTKDQDFYGEGADAVVPDLSQVSLSTIFGSLEAGKPLLDGVAEAPVRQ